MDSYLPKVTQNSFPLKVYRLQKIWIITKSRKEKKVTQRLLPFTLWCLCIFRKGFLELALIKLCVYVYMRDCFTGAKSS